ncbi:MAG: YitT family protein [Saprospiraceae bacterium]
MSNQDTINWKRILSPSSILFTLLGVLSAIIALEGFMIPNHFIDGGVTGVAILFSKVLNVDIRILLIGLNIPFILIGYHRIGKSFAVQTTIAITLLVTGLNTLDIPMITSDKVLIALFGGFFIGLGIGFVIKGGGVLDGLEIIANYTNKRSGFSTSEIVMFINTVVILAVAYQFGVEAGMYSILTYFTAMQISDYVVDGFEEYTALTVVSQKHENIKSIIVNDFNKAISVFKGERGYLPGNFDVKTDCDIIMTIVTRLELHRIKKAILNEDPNAFVYITSIKEVKGGVIKQKVKH